MSRIEPSPSCSKPSGRSHRKDAGARSRKRLDCLSSTSTPTNETFELSVDMHTHGPTRTNLNRDESSRDPHYRQDKECTYVLLLRVSRISNNKFSENY